MSNIHVVEFTDTFAGEANYSWVRRAEVVMPEMAHYGYDGSQGYAKAAKAYRRELMRKAKAAMGLTGVRGETVEVGETIEFRPYGANAVMFID